MPNIQVIQPQEASGRLKEIYDDLQKSRGKIAEVHKIQSLHPESIVKHMELYMEIMYGKSPLRRVQREMMAVVVSVANNCEYCQVHHLEAVSHYWKDEERLRSLQQDFRTADLSEKDLLWAELAWELTQDPSSSHSHSIMENLKRLGVGDRAILDGTLVIAYFNFVNRIVLGLGLELENDPGGYKYD